MTTDSQPDPLSCPRCGQPLEQRFYGPCDTCRAELRASVRGEARDVGDADFVPTMHVTPNAVALKDD